MGYSMSLIKRRSLCCTLIFMMFASWGLARAQDRTRDPLSEPEQNSGARSTAGRDLPAQERTNDPLSAPGSEQERGRAGEKQAKPGAEKRQKAPVQEPAKQPTEEQPHPQVQENTNPPIEVQTKTASPPSPSRSMERTAAGNLIGDQKWFWTSPFRIREKDMLWLLPFTAGTAIVMGSDTAIEKHLPQSQSTIDRSRTFSDAGMAAFIAGSTGAYFLGRFSNDDHLRETGVLSSEAMLGSLAEAEVFKGITGRDRPLEGDGRGRWLQGGSSFPSIHSAVAWSAATVIAGEYPGWLTEFFAYGGAAAVSVARVTGREHFTSDALIGSALGWYMGHHVVSAHARESASANAKWGTFEKAPTERAPRQSKNMGSPYVPLDSWVYPAFDRLIALGYVRSAFVGLRPWTRMECARLLEEAEDQLGMAFTPRLPGGNAPPPTRKVSDAERISAALKEEFARERTLLHDGGGNLSAQVESLYTRFTGISGQPLTDGYYFGQTVFNDYGRPYQEGFNNVTGVSSYATAGPLALYLRGEYQYAPAGPALSPATRAAEAAANVPSLPIADIPGGPFPDTNRFCLLDSYVALNVSNWQLSFGKQSLWWGPDNGGALQLSNNAEPINMLRLSRVSPFTLPSLFGVLGPIRSETFVGQLQGQHFIVLGNQQNLPPDIIGSLNGTIDPQPYVWGQKINLRPTPNLEIGVSALAVFAGYGRPLTLSTFEHTFSLHGSFQTVDPGKRTGGFDFSYRIPGLRNWLTLYASALTWDEINPIAYPRRSAMNPGIYMPQIPKLRKLDLRVEGVYTDLPNLLGTAGFYYSNYHYVNGYTNNGQIMGSWIGRDGRGTQVSSRYWLTPRSTVRVYYRNETVDPAFVGGGHLYDVGTQADIAFRSLTLSPNVQFEHWRFPVLVAGPQSNTTVSLQLTYQPNWKKN
jgi:hypothetical protein